ncbi:MAG: DUF4091 domain-containing protein [Clostridia bacterium]|nr:DUF4091 domain-containing protein [Clostridia bacterium]
MRKVTARIMALLLTCSIWTTTACTLFPMGNSSESSQGGESSSSSSASLESSESSESSENSSWDDVSSESSEDSSSEEPEIKDPNEADPDEEYADKNLNPDYENGVVWTATGAEKFLQDYEYADRYDSKRLKINAFQNETESGQILLTPETNVTSYTIKLSDLEDGKGNTLKKENFEVFNQKYIELTYKQPTVWPYPLGWYPDALIPFDKAVEYDENKIVAGQNQGIWINVKPPKGQKAGNYKGTFELTVDSEKYLVPVTVTVYDYELSDEQHIKNYFLLNWTEVADYEGYTYDEGDSSLAAFAVPMETQTAYYEFLLDYGINMPGDMPGSMMNNYLAYGEPIDQSRIFDDDYDPYMVYLEEKYERYLTAVEKYSQDPRCNGYMLMAQSTVLENYDGQGSSTPVLDKYVMKNLIERLYTRSLETGINMLAKAHLYLTWIDEYDHSSKMDSAAYNLEYMNGFFEQISEYLAGKNSEYPLGDGVSESFRAEVLESIANITHLQTGKSVLSFDPETQPFTFIPTIEVYASEWREDVINSWAEATDNEMWTYTANNPKPPYPSYHIDDYLLSSRMLSWIMYEKDIVGNLYWDTTLSWSVNDDDFGETVDDFYANAHRYPGSVGEGWLLYPGKNYGMTGPVGSLRLNSIRDGAEEYNLMYALEEYAIQRASDRGVTYNDEDFNSVLRCLSDALYRDCSMTYGEGFMEEFASSRKALAEMLVLASKKGVIVEKTEQDGDDIVFTVSAPKDLTLRINGEYSSEIKGDYKVYRIVVGKGESFKAAAGDYVLTMKSYLPLEVYYTWNDIVAEETENGTIYPDTRYYVNNGMKATMIQGEDAAKNTENQISIVTLSEDNAVGGRTSGTYYYITPTDTFVASKHGFMLLPKEDKAFYEQYKDTAKLRFDVHIKLTGDHQEVMRLYFLLGQKVNEQEHIDEWITFEIPLKTVLNLWDTFHNPTSKTDVTKIALFSLWGAYGEDISDFGFYIGNIRIEQ